ncbi:hypothetical protein OHR68_13725 [Spirillospora sp. NBC_00431]
MSGVWLRIYGWALRNVSRMAWYGHFLADPGMCSLQSCQCLLLMCELDAMGRPEKPLDPAAGPVEEFAAALRELRNEAGRPTYRVLARRCGVSVTALTVAARGDRLPTLKVALAFAQACGADRAEWERRWHAAESAAASVADADGKQPQSPAPYLGLACYEPEDADRFFGRDELVSDLLERLDDGRVVAVVGPSGSGKSSVLRAGVIPAARRAASEPLAVVLLTPGADPLAALASALASALGCVLGSALGPTRDAEPGPEPPGSPPGPDAGTASDPETGGADLAEWARRTGALPDGGDLLVVVDQFEEVFTLCTDPGRRTAFIDVLLSARAPGSRVRVVLGLRGDFFGHCAGHRELGMVLRTGTVLVAPMSAAELREVIVKPAARMQVLVEPALVATVVAEATGEPGMLPLVSHALRETWRRRRGRTLSLHAYRSTGGIHGAVAQSAETLWAALPTAQRPIARRILLRLVTVDADGQATRRPLAYTDLPGAPERSRDEPGLTHDGTAASGAAEDGAGGDGAGGDAGRVLEVLAGARLVSMGGQEVWLAHEALITAWPRLRDWVEQDRAGLRVHQQITEAARTWRDLNRDPDTLLRGSRLAVAREWAERDDNATALTDAERAFLAAAVTAEQAEYDTVRRRNRRLRALSATLAILLLAATLAGVVAVRQGQLALARQHQAQSRDLAGRATRAAETDPVEAIRLALAAYRHAPTSEARGSLLSIAATTRFTTVLRTSNSPLSAVALSSDGARLAVAVEPREALPGEGRAHPGGVEIWSTLSGKMEAFLEQAQVSALGLSPDGRRLVTGGPVGDDVYARVTVWDLTRRLRIAASTIPAVSPPAVPNLAVAFDDAGRALATATPPRRLWDVSTSTPVPVNDHNALPPGLTGDSRDGRIHVRTTRLDDRDSGEPVRGITAVVDRRTGQRLWTPKHVKKKGTDITAWQLSSDGRVLYLADTGNGRIIRWDLVRRSPLRGLYTDPMRIQHLALSLDGRVLVSVARDGSIKIHDQRRPFPLGHAGTVDSLTYSPDGRTLASVSGADSQIHLRDPATHRLRGLLQISRHEPAHLTDLVHDPRIRGLTIKGAALRPVKPGGPGVGWGHGPNTCDQGVTINPAGHQLACASHGFLALLDVRPRNQDTGRKSFLSNLFPWAYDGGVRNLRYSHDGNRLAVLNSRGQLAIWNIAHGRKDPLPTTQPPPSHAVAFSPDGRFLALGGDDRTITLWDMEQGTLWATFTGHTQAVTSLAFSPDGQSLASGSADHTIITWPLNTTTAQNRLKHLLDTNNGSQP